MSRAEIALGLAGLMMASVAAAGVTTAAVASAAEGAPVTCTEYGTGRWVTVNADHVNVRAGWGTSYPVIGRQNHGDHLCIIGGHPDNQDSDVHWWAFDYHGQKGWIIETYVTPGWH